MITVSRPSTSLRVLLMEGSGFPNKGVQREAPTYAQNFKNRLLPSSNVSLNQKVESTLSFMLPILALVTDHIMKKGIFNRQNLTKILLATCIFWSTIMTYLKKFVGPKSLNSIENTKHCPPG